MVSLALIDLHHAADRPEPGAALTASETIYLTVADSAGNMISFINSLFDAFGSGVVVPGTGFALQDRGAGFTLEQGLPNTVAPGKLTGIDTIYLTVADSAGNMVSFINSLFDAFGSGVVVPGTGFALQDPNASNNEL